MKTSFDEGNQWCWKLYRWFVNKFESVLTAWYKRFKLRTNTHTDTLILRCHIYYIRVIRCVPALHVAKHKIARKIVFSRHYRSISIALQVFLAFSIMSCYIDNLLVVLYFFFFCPFMLCVNEDMLRLLNCRI